MRFSIFGSTHLVFRQQNSAASLRAGETLPPKTDTKPVNLKIPMVGSDVFFLLKVTVPFFLGDEFVSFQGCTLR